MNRSDEPISRRAVLGALFGRRNEPMPESRAASAATLTSPASLVDLYRAVLQQQREHVAFGVRERELPASVDEIKKSILAEVTADTKAATRSVLRDAYGSLAWFCVDDELQVLRAGKAALDAGAVDEASRRAVVAAFEVRSRKLALLARLEKEFDQVTSGQDGRLA